MIVLVSGGRDYTSTMFIYKSLDQLKLIPLEDLLIHGDAAGADREARAWARFRYIPYLSVPAPWPQKGKSAGILRNLRMRDFMGLKPNLLVAFPGGDGTAHMIKSAVASGILLWQPRQHEELPSQLSDLLCTLRGTALPEKNSHPLSIASNED